MDKEVILLKIIQIEKQLCELKESLLLTETKTHICNDNLEMIVDYTHGTTGTSIKHRCKICGIDKIPFNYCTSPANHIGYTNPASEAGYTSPKVFTASYPNGICSGASNISLGNPARDIYFTNHKSIN